MASSFDRWEKDPFFSVAEEVQQSADRMESTYRTWIHAIKDDSSEWNLEELGRDLRTTISTTKWQLEEFERAVQLSSPSEEARDRHCDFVLALKDQILKIEKYLQESACSEVKSSMHLDEGERNELALFLSAPPLPRSSTRPKKQVRGNEIRRGVNRESGPDFLKNAVQSIELSSSEANSEKSVGIRRAASAADIGAWKIAILDDVSQKNSSNGRSFVPPRRAPSSGSLSSKESAAIAEWSKNSIKKSKVMSCHQGSNAGLLRSPEFPRGNDECYEKNSGGVDCDDKQLNGWYESIQRQLRRSQPQTKSNPFTNIAVGALMFICLIVLIVLHNI
ncbi:Cytochrome B5, n3,ATCB5-D,CB5-D [Hibiscus syriacus]|uniref:Cytochrome B5, n3,ATCB5-D,CB5-D n=1 Tax=Hibiscus syriacus TaxID=106335 RepID=A0A6A2Z1G5_HIBSY|nr:Cytochrome B5, n3,ATCB5-D,CB5-D [Hibiscus syriacus]